MPTKVLVIEDSTTITRVLQRVVEKAGYEAVCASSLFQARHLFDQDMPESFLCAIVDFHLPDAPMGESIDFTIESYIPTIVVTGREDEETREIIVSKPIVDYFTKGNNQFYEYLSRLLVRLQKNKQIGILVAEGSRQQRNKTLALLQRHNFVTYAASTAEDARNQLAQHKDIRLLITTNDLPDASGMELVDEMRVRYSKEELCIIGLSDRDHRKQSANFIKSGANDYLTRPFYLEEFFCRVMQNIEYIENIEALHRAANSDYLTGLFNRRYFFQKTENHAQQSNEPACIALMDIDYFKNINDTYGHDAGDMVLKTIANLIIGHFAAYIPARMGGEEFCVYLPQITIEQAKDLIEQFRMQVESLSIPFAGNQLSCTISIGLTDQFNGSVTDMLSRADALLYQAKEAGRNQLVCG
ncbi:GGDEF domain-containing response regulator [Neptunicella marina]|uniref:diguanylate cyclase n=1 Tax=Neptunicella marina TaxID=2125989 RepID=A0A8J6IVA0_9ALTE|nr:diguanylate cyclase [Neptunicella marina]MBC3766547.1 diguanylate cyclase [Neptunicella marina]